MKTVETVHRGILSAINLRVRSCNLHVSFRRCRGTDLGAYIVEAMADLNGTASGGMPVNEAAPASALQQQGMQVLNMRPHT